MNEIDPEFAKDYRIDTIHIWLHYFIVWPAAIIMILLVLFGGFEISASAKLLAKVGQNMLPLWAGISLMVMLWDRFYTRYLEMNGDEEAGAGKNVLKGMLKRERKVNELAMLVIERREQKLKILYKKYDLGDDINADLAPC